MWTREFVSPTRVSDGKCPKVSPWTIPERSEDGSRGGHIGELSTGRGTTGEGGSCGSCCPECFYTEIQEVDRNCGLVLRHSVGEWLQVLRASGQCDEKAAVRRRRRRRRRSADDVEQRATWAETLIQLGELSSAREALEGCEIAPGTTTMLDALKDERRRPALPRAPLPPDVMDVEPEVPF